MRHAAQVALLGVALSLGGCSFVFVEGPPPPSAPAGTPANCTTSKVLPNVDLGLAVLSGIESVLTYATTPYETDKESYSRGLAAALYGVVFLLSSREGKRKVEACQAYRSGERYRWPGP